MKLIQCSVKSENESITHLEEWNSDQTLAIAYFPPHLSQSLFWTKLKHRLPQSIIMGCSGAGEIRSSELVDDEIVVTLAKFDNTEIRYGSFDLTKETDSEKAGAEFAKIFLKAGLKAIYILSDGLNVNGSALIKGIRSTIGNDVIISGGLAADGANFKNTFVLIDGVPTEKAISGVAFYGDRIQVISSANGGWEPFGPVRKITKASANLVYELDNKPALALYKEFLGDQAKKLPASALLFPLYLGSGPESTNRKIVRTILSVDETAQTMTFAGDMPVGTEVRLMHAGHEKLIQAAETVAQKNFTQLSQSSKTLSLVVSCVGRRLVLGEQTEFEVKAVFDQLPKDAIQTGFYSYGEIGKSETGLCDLHNQTMTITTIQEKELD